MNFVHFERNRVKITCAFILLQWVTVSGGWLKNITCSIKTSSDKYIDTNCETYQETSDCPFEKFQIQKEIGSPGIIIRQCNESNCYVDISSPFIGRGSPVFFINGYDLQWNQKCVKIIFASLKTWKGDEVLINSTNIILPRGIYWLTAYTTHFSGKRSIFVRKSFNVWNSREKRSRSCRSIQCDFERYEFIRDTGRLRFFFKFEEETSCDKGNDNKVALLKLQDDSAQMTEDKCKSSNNTHDPDIISKAVRYRKSMEVSREYLDFPNIDTGCYVIRARPGCYFGFFWLNSTNIVDLNKWNTSILLIPRQNQRSLYVQWTWPSFPFNFTGWKLKLWKMEDYPVQCNGQNPLDKKLTIMTPPESKILTTNYTFVNLSVGYYCVRLGGIDVRCPEDGCDLRSSATVILFPSSTEYTKIESVNLRIPIILLVVAVIIIAIFYSLICFRHNWSSKRAASQYELVSENGKKLETPPILLIWTKFCPINSPSPEPLIPVLKHLLENYCFCKVFDYLDPLSLPAEQCRLLMSDPTSWLNSQLRKSDVKILIVASEGAFSRQKELKNSSKKSNIQTPNPLDNNLFPYVLHFLQESFKLSADYSRVFQVCFPDVYGHGMELDGLVASARYNMPEHIKELAYRIHGSNDYTNRLMKDSLNGGFTELQKAITLTKNTKIQDV